MPPVIRKKRIIFCFDGTWNQLSAENSTNVVLLAQMIRPVAHNGTAQVVYYDEGIGTGRSWPRQILDGAFGWGMLAIMREAYRFLIFNYEPGDEIFAFGFSRGAFTARSFIGFIRHAGILDVASAPRINEAIAIYKDAPFGGGRESQRGYVFRAAHCTSVCVSAADRDYRAANVPGFDPAAALLLSIRYVGLWDTVRALGLPEFIPGSAWFNQNYGFHNAQLTSKIRAARHAIAIDELRPTFRDTPFGHDKVRELNERTRRKQAPPPPAWQLPYQEQWFPGVHGAVGGGGQLRGLSDGALEWVLSGARQAGLDLRDDRDGAAYRLRPDPFDPLAGEARVPFTKRGLLGWLRRRFDSPRKGPGTLEEVSLAALQRWHAPPGRLPGGRPYRPASLRDLASQIADWQEAALSEFKSLGFEDTDLEDYQVRRGDTLGKLARARLGAAKRWPELFALNRERIDNPNALAIGTWLRLPRPAK